MAMNLGDAFLTFRGDLTQLNLAFDGVAQSAQEKLGPAREEVDGLGKAADAAGTQISAAWQRVAKATVENFQAQKELSAALFTVKSTGGESADAMDRLAIAQARAAAASTELATAREATIVKDHEASNAERELAEATNESTFSMHEARGAMALLGEETGVKIPRHIRSFVAELPGVGKAFEVAFSGFALFALVEILAEATKKLTEFVSETFIYTEEDKKAYEAQIELNKAIQEQAQKIKELKEAYDLLGLSGSGKTAAEFMKLTDEVRKQEQALSAARDTLFFYKNGIENVSKAEADAAQLLIGKLTGQNGLLAELYQQQANLSKQYDQEIESEQMAHGQAVINAAKTIGDARIALLQAQSRLTLALVTNSYFDQGRTQAAFAEQKYELELSTLERQRGLVLDDMAKRKKLGESDPSNPDKLRELNAQIEALEKQHHATLLNGEVDFLEKIKAIRQQQVATQQPGVAGSIELSPEGKALQQLQEGLKALGVQGSATWTEMRIEAEDAFEKIKQSGGTSTDVLQAHLKLLQAKLGEALSFGDRDVAEMFKAKIASITKELEKLGITTDKTAEKTKKFGDRFGGVSGHLDHFQHQLVENRGEMTNTEAAFDMVMTSASQAVGTAITAWVSGEESLGQALKQSIAQESAAIAGKAAMYALYWTAWGIADSFWAPERAAADFAAAETFAATAVIAGGIAYGMRGSGSGGGSRSGNDFNDGKGAPVATTPTSSGNVVPVQNVQHFATGGLVSSPTLAVIGDSITSASRAGSEAILPLEDPRAMSRIASAIAGRMPASGGAGGNIHITLESDIVQTVRKIDHAVRNNGVKLTASNALRVTKKA